jgi:protein-tyrosine phosphatase
VDYVDLHCHLLPALDDGPASFPEAVAMIEVAWQAGTRRMVATPHMFQAGLGCDDPERVADLFAEFERALAARRQGGDGPALEGLELALGAENFVGEAFLRALESGRILSLGASRYVLIEFWPLVAANTAIHAVDALRERGLVPVIAHVERYGFLHDDPRRLEPLLAAGCVAQVNASALLGHQGLRPAQLTDRWLRRGWIGVVASDGHGATTRPAVLEAAADCLRSRYGAATAEACLRDNPAAILADGTVALPPAQKSNHWWRRLTRR